MVNNILPTGTKTNTGLILAFLAVATMIGFDISEAEATATVEAITAVVAVLGTVLAKYGADDKETRLKKTKEKLVNADTEDELIKKAQEIVKNL